MLENHQNTNAKHSHNLQIASDLHIEYRNDTVPDLSSVLTPKADILALIGDIGSFYKREQLTGFLRQVCAKFKTVLFIAGNHEYYIPGKGYRPKTLGDLNKIMYEIEAEIPNLHILDRSSVRVGNTVIAGCTLWSDLQEAIPEYLKRKIYGINTTIYNNKFKTDLKYIESMIEYCQKNQLRLVMLTHYVPSFTVTDSNGLAYPSLYASNLDHLLQKNKVDTWICGHIHRNFDVITDGGTRLIGNQKGKERDNLTDYSKEFLVEL